MLIIPAIDLKDGHCVRLKQGDMDQVTTFSESPADMAAHWLAQGARRLHLVDLNGAFAGKPQNLAAIKAIRPGRRWNEPHDEAVKVLTKGLIRLGLLEGKPSQLIKEEAYKKFYMHRTGHWLGMDVHDVGTYMIGGKWREFEPGMVLTVEPGLYIARDCLEVDPCWRGIGVRIEDDVVVTPQGCDVLTAALAKTVDDIEAIMAGNA